MRVPSVIVCLMCGLRRVETKSRFCRTLYASLPWFCVQLDFYAYNTQKFAGITNCDKCYYKVRQVLQTATSVITKCDIITKCDGALWTTYTCRPCRHRRRISSGSSRRTGRSCWRSSRTDRWRSARSGSRRSRYRRSRRCWVRWTKPGHRHHLETKKTNKPFVNLLHPYTNHPDFHRVSLILLEKRKVDECARTVLRSVFRTKLFTCQRNEKENLAWYAFYVQQQGFWAASVEGRGYWSGSAVDAYRFHNHKKVNSNCKNSGLIGHRLLTLQMLHRECWIAKRSAASLMTSCD